MPPPKDNHLQVSFLHSTILMDAYFPTFMVSKPFPPSLSLVFNNLLKQVLKFFNLALPYCKSLAVVLCFLE